MHQNHLNCLFELWQKTSAPMFHTSEFWPTFTNDAVQDFLRAKTDEPLSSSPTNRVVLLENRQKIEAFLAEIKTLSEEKYACWQIYIDFESARLAELDLIFEATDEAKSQQLNDQLFGVPAELHEADALSYLLYNVQALEPVSTLAADARQRLIEAWSAVEPNVNIKELFTAYDDYRVQLKPYIAENFAFLDELLASHSDMLTTEETVEALDAALEHMECNSSGWTAAIRDGAPNAFIDYDKKNIVLPHGRPYSKTHLRGLIIHEIGVHVTRSVNGEQSLEKLAAVGLPGYGPAEEAMGTLFENAPREHFELMHSLVAFAIINFASHSHSFRKVHELTKALLICLDKKTEEQLVHYTPDYGRMAFSRCIRMMRLGTGVIVDRSTTKYWRGLGMLRDYFEIHGTSNQVIEEFLLGKYDCLKPAQLKLIKKH